MRRATIDDLATLETILREASLANPGDVEFLSAHPEVMVVERQPLLDGRIWLAESDTAQALGYSTLLAPQHAQSEIDGLFVRPTHWRQGVGRVLLQACAAQARAEGAHVLFAVVNPHALEFYAALGFEPVADDTLGVVAHGLAFAMRCRLPPEEPHQTPT